MDKLASNKCTSNNLSASVDPSMNWAPLSKDGNYLFFSILSLLLSCTDLNSISIEKLNGNGEHEIGLGDEEEEEKKGCRCCNTVEVEVEECTGCLLKCCGVCLQDGKCHHCCGIDFCPVWNSRFFLFPLFFSFFPPNFVPPSSSTQPSYQQRYKLTTQDTSLALEAALMAFKNKGSNDQPIKPEEKRDLQKKPSKEEKQDRKREKEEEKKRQGEERKREKEEEKKREAERKTAKREEEEEKKGKKVPLLSRAMDPRKSLRFFFLSFRSLFPAFPPFILTRFLDWRDLTERTSVLKRKKGKKKKIRRRIIRWPLRDGLGIKPRI